MMEYVLNFGCNMEKVSLNGLFMDGRYMLGMPLAYSS